MGYSKHYAAHATTGGIVTIPDEVYEDQSAYDGKGIEVLGRDGDRFRAILRGDLYGLGTPGTGDPVVELIDGGPDENGVYA